jgi:hypothetical protein
MSTLSMFSAKQVMQLLSRDGVSLTQEAKYAIKNIGNNAFAPLMVLDNSTLSSFYYPGYQPELLLNKLEERMMQDRPVFNVIIKPRQTCK